MRTIWAPILVLIALESCTAPCAPYSCMLRVKYMYCTAAASCRHVSPVCGVHSHPCWYHHDSTHAYPKIAAKSLQCKMHLFRSMAWQCCCTKQTS
ncbi:hypothetical protein COO60DRAFT_1546313, partial [Scenedesmus sp. NREL 46B-D3]